MFSQNNVAVLTQSHRAIAAKKRAKKDQVKEVLFDEEARREFLTGFHKRKVKRTETAKKNALERLKQDRRETRNEQRRALRERAKENAAQVEKVYGGTLSEEEWTGIQESDGMSDHEVDHEFEGKEELATVTVVEDFDLDSFGPTEMKKQPRTMKEDSSTSANTIVNAKRSKNNAQKQKPKIRYQTKEARKQERFKQRTRRIEKAGSGKKNGSASKR
ncbi:nucleolar protein 12-domain-containing protein [Amanita rubescens]|nr:nucleolar protein 12-domain-containing protein [Amanita rubescens]